MDQRSIIEYYVDTTNPSVRNAITFVRDQLSISLELHPESFLLKLSKTLQDIPLCYYIPAWTPEDKEERAQIINRYKNARAYQIEYYLLYHYCDEFAVLLWAILKSNGVETMIVSQTAPFRHTYLVDVQGKVHDVLLAYNNVMYPYDIINCRSFRTPRDFYANVFMISDDLRVWEKELLVQLDEIDQPL